MKSKSFIIGSSLFEEHEISRCTKPIRDLSLQGMFRRIINDFLRKGGNTEVSKEVF